MEEVFMVEVSKLMVKLGEGLRFVELILLYARTFVVLVP